MSKKEPKKSSDHPPLFARTYTSASAHGNGDTGNQALLTVDEVAEILRVPRSWIYSHQDQLPTVRLGRYVRFKRSEIELFVDQQKAC
jgi:excisionase family DNA binding protein